MCSLEKLFSLLRFSLWDETIKVEVSKDEFAQVLALAQKQTVYGLAFDALSQLNSNYDKQQVFEALAVSQTIQQQNARVNKELKELVLMFSHDGLDCIVVKGQTFGQLYTKPDLRMSGDIDFLIYQEYHVVKNIIENQFSIKLPSKMVEREIEFKHGGVPYELHNSIRDWAKKKHQTVWDDLMEEEWQEKHYVEIDGVKVRTLSPTLNAAFVFIHLFFHFIREGVSLRQLCDWAIVLHHYKNEIDRNKLADILCHLDITRGYKAFGCILVDEIGLPEGDFPIEIKEDDRQWKEKILHDIFKGGNFGKHNHKAKSAIGFKLETLGMAIRNSFRYYRLCPSEVGGMINRLLKGNLKIIFS